MRWRDIQNGTFRKLDLRIEKTADSSDGRTTGNSAETWVLQGVGYMGDNFPVSLFPLLRLFRFRQNDFCPNALRPNGRSA